MPPKRLVLFASGSGSNAQAVMSHFAFRKEEVEIVALFTNNPEAYALRRAAAAGIPTYIFTREHFRHREGVVQELQSLQPDLIVLAGFLWLVPEHLVAAFPRQIINIHPALLPKFGGKGMYGHHVHEAVVQAGEAQTGITIHYVNAHYDEGQTILQACCPVFPDDYPEKVAARVLRLEHFYLPRAIEQLLLHAAE